MTEEINERKQMFKKLFDSDLANKFLDSEYFDLSQQIIGLEHNLKLSQQQAAQIVNMPLSDFLSFEMGASTEKNQYLSIIHNLKRQVKDTSSSQRLSMSVRNIKSDVEDATLVTTNPLINHESTKFTFEGLPKDPTGISFSNVSDDQLTSLEAMK